MLRQVADCALMRRWHNLWILTDPHYLQWVSTSQGNNTTTYRRDYLHETRDTPIIPAGGWYLVYAQLTWTGKQRAADCFNSSSSSMWVTSHTYKLMVDMTYLHVFDYSLFGLLFYTPIIPLCQYSYIMVGIWSNNTELDCVKLTICISPYCLQYTFGPP